MRLIYQQMLAAVLVIVSMLTLVGLVFTQYTTRTVEDNVKHQLNHYASGVAKDIQTMPHLDRLTVFDKTQIKSDARWLRRQRIVLSLFNVQRQRVYISDTKQPKITITQQEWRKLKHRQTVNKWITTDMPNSVPFGVRKMAVLKPIYNYQRRFLGVVVVRSNVEKAAHNLAMLRRNLMIAFIFSVTIALGLSYLFSHLIGRRLSSLQLLTRRIAQGDYTTPANITTQDEIGWLAQDINHMMTALAAQEAQLEAQEERRQEFMANVAHEMRTPLTTIAGIAEGLKYDVIAASEKARSYDLIKNEADRLTRLIKDNLDYERLRQNEVILHKTTFNSRPVLMQLLNQLTPKAQPAGNQVQLDMPVDVMVFADQDRFTQIMFNIINNAIQFTEKGRITVKAWHDTAGAHFTVTDTGIGMTAEQTQRIWERYYKADPSRVQKGESGLGMPIIYQLIKVHHGKIAVKSILGKGTTFSVQLPDKEH